MNALTQFKHAISKSGITPPSEVVDDGMIHRFSSNGKSDNKDGWYVFHSDEIAVGSFGDWKRDISQIWCADIGRKLTKNEQSAHKARTETMKLKREAEDIKTKAEAKQRASDIWAKSVKVEDHPYFTRKLVNAYGIKQSGDALIIPLRADGEIHSLQFINADGGKKFLTGGRIKDCYFSIGKPQDVICICEGYATGASIYEATGYAVAIAFNAGNLLEVATAIHAKYPALKLVMCADDDVSGIGVDKANIAAQVVGADVVVPDFGDNRPEGVSDFNDLHQLKGLEAVKLAVSKVAKVAKVAGVQVANVVKSDWGEPCELIQNSKSSPYPIDALPIVIRNAVKEALDFTQCPPALAACNALSALSIAAQHLANVSRAEGLTGPISIYTLVIADSGERKSTIDKHFTTAINEWEIYQEELLADDIKRQNAKHHKWTMQVEGLKQKIKETSKQLKSVDELGRLLTDLMFEEPKAIKVPRLIYGDVTPEQLSFSLAKGWPSSGILSNEAGIVFGSHGMTGDSAMRSMSLLNILWDGGTLAIDRRTSESYRLQGARLTMGLAIQADTIKNFFDNSKKLARGTGFAARFLIACPESKIGYRPFKESPQLWLYRTKFNQEITDLLNTLPTFNDKGGILLKTLKFSPEAKKEWIKFHDEVESAQKPDGEMSDIKDVASKAADNVARMAALFHLFEHNDNDTINAENVVAAGDIVTWHLYEAKRFLQQIASPSHIANAIKIDQYILRYCREHKTNVIQQNHIRKHGTIRDTKLIKDALIELAEANRIRLILDGRTHLVEVNPELLEVSHVKGQT